MDILSEQQIAIMLLDLSMPHIPGEKVLARVTNKFPEIPIVIITAAGNENSASNLLNSGAFDYVIKPLEEISLVTAVNQAMSFRKMNGENEQAHLTS